MVENQRVPSDPEIGFRLLTRDDFGLLDRWLSTPHVRLWWREPHDLAGVESEFGPCVDRVDPTLVYIVTVSVSDRVTVSARHSIVPIGMVQTYLVSDTPEYEAAVGVVGAAGIDLFIGELEFIGVGLGKAIIARFVSEIGWSAYPRAKRYMAGPSVRNVRSRRAFEAAGFLYTGLADVANEPDPEAVMVLERPPTT
jgi:aminoglycoside 6'-N-acetyltransferase